MAGTLQPLADQFKIVNADGTPTPYFIKWAQQRQIDISGGVSLEQMQLYVAEQLGTHQVIAGDGLSGGGTLISDPEIYMPDSGVTPGSYTNTNLTVDEKGRITAAANGSGGGGGGGPDAPFTVPSVSDFTILNGAPSVTTATVANGLAFNVPSLGTQIAFLGYNSPPSLTTFDIIYRAQDRYIAGVTGGPGFVFRNSTSGRILIFSDFDTRRVAARWNNYTSFASDIISPSAYSLLNGDTYPKWKRMTLSAGVLRWYASNNGYDWALQGSENLSTFISSIDQVGYGALSYTSDVSSTLQSWTMV